MGIQGRSRRWVGPLLSAATVGGLGVVLWAWAKSRPGYLGAAVASPTFVRCGLIVLASLTALVVIGAILYRGGRPARRVRRAGLAADRDGTAVVEFALLFPIATAVVLIMVQAMLMMSATVLVNYAAYAAARTAIVWIPKDMSGNVPSGYDPEAENVVGGPPRSYKLFMIRAAAASACVPISGETSAQAPGAATVRDGIENYYRQLNAQPPNWIRYLVGGKFAYSWAHTRVQLDDWYSTPNTYDEHHDVTVWVYHDYNLSVPFAAALFARSSSADGYISEISAMCTLSNEGVSDVIKEDKFQ